MYEKTYKNIYLNKKQILSKQGRRRVGQSFFKKANIAAT
jgi:hypothetical protein